MSCEVGGDPSPHETISPEESTPLKVVMTVMVRDEADIIGAMIRHHRAQGVDHVVVTDNGSIDGTPQILAEFAKSGFVTVWHDPVHRKQQYQTVTKMARFAATDLAADWVVNADADEFWVASDASRTLRDALDAVDPAVPYLTVPVVNLTGAPARAGTGLTRLRYRDLRSSEQIRRSGVPFHPTPDAVHRAHPQVEVSQGNHFVSAPGWGEGAQSSAIEVLHLPWRSWAQYEHKVRVSGEAYRSNPDLLPSPRHHGMQDYRRLLEGQLEMLYVAKHPTPTEVRDMLADGELVEESRLVGLGRSEFPGLQPDDDYTEDELTLLARMGREIARVEMRYEALMQELREDVTRIVADRDRVADELAASVRERERMSEMLDQYRSRFVVRAADRVGRGLRGLRGRATP